MLASSAESTASSQTGPAAGELDLFSFACPDGELYEVTDAFAGLLGVTGGEINGRALPDLVAPEDRPALSRELGALSSDARQAILESRFIQSDGHVIYVQWVARRMAGSDLWRAAGTDAADLVKLLADRRDLRTRLDLAIGQATATMWDLDLREDRFTWEAQAAQILGVSLEAIPTNPAELAEVVHPEDRHAMVGALRRLIEEGATEVGVRVGQDAEVRYLSMRGRILNADSDGQTRRAVGLLLDVTTEKAMEEQLLRMSASDALTGIPNRRAFDQALRGEWRRCTRAREPLTLIMVDIDGFKRFNDTFGHLVGDQALIAVARAMAATLHREGDLLARYGGEEFAIVLPNTDTDGALVVGQQLAEAVRGITIRQALGWNLSVSVGTASWHPDRERMKPPVLLGRADEALYAAKTAGKNRVIAYEESLAARDTLQAAITEGLKQSEFELHYQPLINLDDGHLVGFEALMRWNRPGHGLLAPHAFIPIAETTTLICDLGRWALQTAACQLAAWSAQGLDLSSSLRVAVNVSARHAVMPQLVTDVQAALATSGIVPVQLELELTETALQDSTAVRAELVRVRSLGVSVAIDDFGTGYTSIAELADMPADVLKIDRTFTTSPDPRQSNLIKLIIEAAHAFDLRVVAEGIEEEHTLHTMRDLDCDIAQGYLIARPMPAEQVPAWITRHSALSATSQRALARSDPGGDGDDHGLSVDGPDARRLEALRLAGVGNWVLDLDSGRMEWSDEYRDLYGVDPGQAMTTRRAFQELMHPEDRHILDDAIVRIAADGTTVDVRYRITRADDGAERFIRSHVSARSAGPDEPRSIIGTAQDVTDLVTVLSPREAEMLTLLADGLSGDDIAARLVLSPATVRTHVQNAMVKLGTHTRGSAIAAALRSQEIGSDTPPHPYVS